MRTVVILKYTRDSYSLTLSPWYTRMPLHSCLFSHMYVQDVSESFTSTLLTRRPYYDKTKVLSPIWSISKILRDFGTLKVLELVYHLRVKSLTQN